MFGARAGDRSSTEQRRCGAADILICSKVFIFRDPINMVIWECLKTTLEIPDLLFRRAKSVAAERGIPLRQLVTEAVQEKLKITSQERPWMKHLGKLKYLHKERKQVEKRVAEAFEQIDQDFWK